MSTRFIHTADWQVGKPFAGIEDVHKRALVQQERLNMIQRIGEAASSHGAEFILVAGDLFDSPTVTKATVSAACSALGRLGIPVIAIPGNHDHGGPGSIWEQEFFRRECANLAPNFRLLLTPEPLEIESAILYPCPLLRRAESLDPTAWLRSVESTADGFGDKARIVVAHGSTQGFGSQSDDEESDAFATNQIDLSRLPDDAFDYVALGDWHGTKQIGPKAWYPGTPELDRFPRGDANDPGHVLAVNVTRGGALEVESIDTAHFRWHQLNFDFTDDAALSRLRHDIDVMFANRAQEDFLRLVLTGSLGIEAAAELEQFIESLQARLLRLKLSDQTVIAPTPEESEALTQRVGDPLVSRVASQLVEMAAGADEQAAIARVALRELHAACLRR